MLGGAEQHTSWQSIGRQEDERRQEEGRVVGGGGGGGREGEEGVHAVAQTRTRGLGKKKE